MPERFMLLVNYIVQVAIKEYSVCAKLAAIAIYCIDNHLHKLSETIGRW